MPERIAIIGGGIAGMAAAHHLIGAGIDVHLFEADDRLGGKIGQGWMGTDLLPTAADNFLARVPQMIDLARELGLEADLVAPAASEARIYRGGALHALPPTLLGIPADLDGLEASGLVSPDGCDRARADLDAPDDRPDGDESVGSLVRRRLGDEVHEYLVDPLLGGINAGDSDRLSITYGVPQVRAARDRDRSLIRAAQAMRSNLMPSAPVFLSVRGGLQAMLDALAAEFDADASTTIHLSSPVERIESVDGRWRVEPTGDDFDRIILAVPPKAAASLLGPISPDTATPLAGIDMSSVAMTLLALAPGSLPVGPTVSGVLVPRVERLHITAVSIATNKWPELSDRQILRVSVGRRTDTRWRSMSSDELTATIVGDLATIFGQAVEPVETKRIDWIDSLPQYDVDHGLRIDAAEDALASAAPGVHLAGAALRGLGLPACVQSGRDAAQAAVSSIH